MAAKPMFNFVGDHLNTAQQKILDDILNVELQLKQAVKEEVAENLKKRRKQRIEELKQIANSTDKKRAFKVYQVTRELEDTKDNAKPYKPSPNSLANKYGLEEGMCDLLEEMIILKDLYSQLMDKDHIISLLQHAGVNVGPVNVMIDGKPVKKKN